MRSVAISLMTGFTVVALCGCGDASAPGNRTPGGEPAATRPAKTRFATIGTGGLTGVYYPTGGAIAKMVHAKQAEYGVRCTVESTGGSVFNVNALCKGDLDFGIVQSDLQYQAYNGVGKWEKDGPRKSLRAVFSIHAELVTLVAAVDAGIDSVAALKGKRVNIGSPGSGQRVNALDTLRAAGLDPETDLTAEGVKASEAPSLLQDGRIDAFFYTVGHPNGALKEATTGKRKVRFVPIDAAADQLVAAHSYFVKARIPVALYPNAVNDGDVPTFGVKATLMTVDHVDADIVYAITREVFENLETFKKLHPAYAKLTRERMLDGLSAPLHAGARRYFRESGLQP